MRSIALSSTSLLLSLSLYLAHGAKTYNQELAYRGVYYSAATYCKRTLIDSWSCGTPCYVYPNMKEIS